MTKVKVIFQIAIFTLLAGCKQLEREVIKLPLDCENCRQKLMSELKKKKGIYWVNPVNDSIEFKFDADVWVTAEKKAFFSLKGFKVDSINQNHWEMVDSLFCCLPDSTSKK